MYAEIINNTIVNIHNNLPLTYNNISNFFALDQNLLSDLSWSGNDDVHFYQYVENKPELEPNTVLVGPTYSIDHENNLVTGTFSLAPYVPSEPIVPESISARQIRLWLINNGISLSDVNIAINNIENTSLRDSIFVEWEYAPYVDRNHPMLIPLAQALGLNENDIDRGFIEASQL